MKSLIYRVLTIATLISSIAIITAKAQNDLSQAKNSFTLPDIQPVGITLQISSLEPNDEFKFSSKFTTWHSRKDSHYVVIGTTGYTAPDKSVIGAGVGDIAVSISGTEFLEQLPDSQITINSSYTVRQGEKGGYILSTVYEEDKFFFNVVGQGIKLIYPFGDGSYIFFQGQVVNFFKGYTFVGDLKNPLCFELSSKTGLTYKKGIGNILKGNEIIAVFD